MAGFEEAFSDAERAANVAAAEGQRLVKAAKALERAAADGNITGLRRAMASLKAATDTARQAADNALVAWRFNEEQEAAHLSDGYAEELLLIAEGAGLKMKQEGARLLVYPSVLRIQPGDRSLKIDRKAVRALRPSHLVALLKATQQKPPMFRGAQFLEALYEAYVMLTRNNHAPSGDIVLLTDIHKAFTLAPGADYSREEFARDLYLLSSNGPHETKGGLRVAFPASTGTRGSASRLLQTIDEHGGTTTFYGLRFVEAR